MNIKKKLGLKIKEIRKSKKYTQEFVAEKMGIETKSLSKFEDLLQIISAGLTNSM